MDTPTVATPDASDERSQPRTSGRKGKGEGDRPSGGIALPKYVIVILLVLLGVLLNHAVESAWNLWWKWQQDRVIPQLYGVRVFFDDPRKLTYRLSENVDVAKKLQAKRKFNIKPAELDDQLGDLLWLIDIPGVGMFYDHDNTGIRPAIKGEFSADAALDALLKPAGCSKEVVRNEVLLMYCKTPYTLSERESNNALSAEISLTMHTLSDNRSEPQIRRLGDEYCARHTVDACVNSKSKHMFVPRGNAAETLLAFKRIQTQALAPLPFDLLITNEVAGHQTQEINGVFSANEALKQMLKGSGLTRREGQGWALILPAEQLTASVKSAKE